MIYKNIEIFNVAEIYDCPGGGISWMRVPKNVYETLERGDQARNMAKKFHGRRTAFCHKKRRRRRYTDGKTGAEQHDKRISCLSRRYSGHMGRL